MDYWNHLLKTLQAPLCIWRCLNACKSWPESPPSTAREVLQRCKLLSQLLSIHVSLDTSQAKSCFFCYMLISFCKLINEGIWHTKRITWTMPAWSFLTSFAWKFESGQEMSGCVSESSCCIPPKKKVEKKSLFFMYRNKQSHQRAFQYSMLFLLLRKLSFICAQ